MPRGINTQYRYQNGKEIVFIINFRFKPANQEGLFCKLQCNVKAILTNFKFTFVKFTQRVPTVFLLYAHPYLQSVDRKSIKYLG